MIEVSASAVRGMLALASSAGLAVEPLVEGLPFDLASINRLRNVSWDDYCTVVERFEAACGGPEGHVATTAKYHRAILAPEIRRLMSAVISPEALLRFVIRTLCPHSFPTVDFDYARRPDGRFVVSAVCARWRGPALRGFAEASLTCSTSPSISVCRRPRSRLSS